MRLTAFFDGSATDDIQGSDGGSKGFRNQEAGGA
jgi:hypothetical protein